MLQNTIWCLIPGLIHWYGLSTGTGGRHMWMLWWNYGFHKMGEFLH